MNFWSKKLLMAGSGGLFEPITFQPSSALQSWTVPAGINEVMVEAAGSKGCEYNTGGTNPGNYATAGNGGKVICKLKVTPGSTLYIWVGAAGSLPDEAVNNSSDIRISGTELENRVLVAGGGGASGWSDPNYHTYGRGDWGTLYKACGGGAGGGDVGGYVYAGFAGTVTQLEGRGGSQTAGGTGSQGSGSTFWKGTSGQLGMGGAGGSLEEFSNGYGTFPAGSSKGGAGGGGYYGGGGGGTIITSRVSSAACGGGGGGSSYTNPDYCSDINSTQGTNNGAGYIIISKVE